MGGVVLEALGEYVMREQVADREMRRVVAGKVHVRKVKQRHGKG